MCSFSSAVLCMCSHVGVQCQYIYIYTHAKTGACVLVCLLDLDEVGPRHDVCVCMCVCRCVRVCSIIM